MLGRKDLNGYQSHRLAGTIRLLRANEQVDLAKYAEEFPGGRIVSKSEADFAEMNKPKAAYSSQ